MSVVGRASDIQEQPPLPTILATAEKESVDTTWKQQQLNVEVGAKQQVPTDAPMSWPKVIAYILGVLVCLYIFLIGLNLMGTAFKVLGGRNSASLFRAVDNPIAGLMTGVLSTVLVQSSSTSTSIVVAMVGAEQLTVRSSIPIVMGANIGTSVTNTIVSMGQSGNRIDLERAFAGATVHDMFNMLTVLTLLPIESIAASIQGEGGPLYWLTHFISDGLMGREKGSKLFTSPLKTITAPVVNSIIKANKYVILALTLNKPVAKTPTAVNSTSCATSDTLCSAYYCVKDDLDAQFKKISSSSYKKLHKCDGLILDGNGKPCGGEKCYLDAGSFYEAKVEQGPLIKGGFLKGAGDVGGGIISLLVSLALLGGGLIGLCKMLQKVFMAKARNIIRYSVKLNDYLAMLIGVGITIIVQSSSVTTSALTPLCGLGVLPLDKMLPMTLGANIGTTCTALIASLVSLKFGAIQIALCHLFFNIFGILIWFPIKPMRKIPLGAAKLLGLYASYYRFVPGLYILIAFVVIPGTCLAISALFDVNAAAGTIVLLLGLASLGAFEFWWVIGYPIGQPGAYKVLSKEKREVGAAELAAANDAMLGASSEAVDKSAV